MASNPRLAQRISSALIAAIALTAAPTWADITATGDFSPADPATWRTSSTQYVGKTFDGTVTVNNGGILTTSYAYLGYNDGVTGSININGTNSGWKSNAYLQIGFGGNGVVNLTGGAT